MVQKKKKTSAQPAAAKTTKPVQAAPKATQQSAQTSEKCSLRSRTHLFIKATFWGLLVAFLAISIDFLPRLYYQFYPPKPADPNPVVATVNGQEIRLAEVQQLAQSMPQLAGVPFEVVYPRLLDSVVNMRVIANAAETSGVENDELVQKALKTAREQILSQAFLASQLEKMMTEEKLREIYLQEMRNYKQQDEVKARHILVKTKAEADKIRQQLKDGADFKKLVAKESLAKENDGDLGYFTQNMMIPEFATVVFKMNKGAISEPIKTPMGWHVVIVDDKRPASPPKFEDVREELQQIFAAQNVQNLLAQERQKQKVEIVKPAI